MPQGTPYSVLYDSVLAKLISFNLNRMSQDDIYAILKTYLRPAIVQFQYASKQDLEDRDDENSTFNISLDDYEVEILADFMLASYISANYIAVPSLLKTQLVSKDFQIFSPSNQLREIMNMRNKVSRDAQRLLAIYSYM